MLNFSFDGYSQKLITYKAENQPLNIVLSKVSSLGSVRFAFDDDFFSKVTVSINVKSVTAEDFLKQLSLKYPVGYRLIGSTWVVFKDEKIAVIKTKPRVEKHEKPVDPIPVKKTEYKVSRLWDLKGTIIDKTTGTRLKYCKLYIDEYTQPETNELNFFHDEVVGTGEMRASVNYWGYFPLDTVFKVADGKDITIYLTPNSKTGITDNDNYSEYPVHFHKLNNGISIYSNGLVRGGKEFTDFSNLFDFVPGITFNETNSGGIEIRGRSYSTSNIVIDGIPIFNQTHIFGQVSVLNADFIHQNYLIRGGTGADQSVNSSGLLELTGKNSFVKPTINVTATMLDASLFLGIPITKRISISAAIRKSIVDYWPNYYFKNLATSTLTVESTDGSTGNVTGAYSNYYDINSKLSWQPSTRNEINLIFSSSYDAQRRDLQLSSGENYFIHNNSDWRTYSTGLTWKFITPNNWNNSFVANLNTLYQNGRNNSGVLGENKNPDYLSSIDHDSTNLTELHLKWKTEFSVKSLTHVFGAEYSYFKLHYEYSNYYFPDPEKTFSIDDRLSTNNATSQANLFYQMSFTPTPWIELGAGVRSMFDLKLAKFYLQPRFRLDITPNDRLKFFYRFGQEVNSVYKTQRYNSLFQTENCWILPDQRAHVLESWQHIAGGIYEQNGLLINLEAFLITDLGKSSYIRNPESFDHSNLYTFRLGEGSAIRKGIDFNLHYQHSIFNHSLSYSYSDFKEKYLSLNENNYFPDMKNHSHQIKLTEMIRFSGWIAKANFHYFSGMTYLLPTSTSDHLVYSHLPGLMNLDLSIVKQFDLGKIKLETGATFLNILNKKTANSIQYYQLGGIAQNKMVNTKQVSNNFIPSFFVTLKFN